MQKGNFGFVLIAIISVLGGILLYNTMSTSTAGSGSVMISEDSIVYYDSNGLWMSDTPNIIKPVILGSDVIGVGDITAESGTFDSLILQFGLHTATFISNLTNDINLTIQDKSGTIALLSDVNDLNTYLLNDINNIDFNTDDLNNRINDLNSDIIGLSIDISDINTALIGDIEDLEDLIDDVNTDIYIEIGNIQTDITNINNDINDLNSFTVLNLNEIKTNISNIEIDVNDLNTRINDIKGYATFVGLTSSSYDGDIGGYVTVNSICEAEYTDSHICSSDELLLSIKDLNISTWSGTAWIYEGAPGYTANANDCYGFTEDSSTYLGAFWEFNNTRGGEAWLTNCSNTKPVACCS